MNTTAKFNPKMVDLFATLERARCLQKTIQAGDAESQK